jgi:hypothetical protein
MIIKAKIIIDRYLYYYMIKLNPLKSIIVFKILKSIKYYEHLD